MRMEYRRRVSELYARNLYIGTSTQPGKLKDLTKRTEIRQEHITGYDDSELNQTDRHCLALARHFVGDRRRYKVRLLPDGIHTHTVIAKLLANDVFHSASNDESDFGRSLI